MSLFPSIMLPMFLAIVDGTIVAAALPAIAGDLGDAKRISWVVVSYLVAATIASPVYGRLGDILGRKRLMMVALSTVVVATIICGLSTSVTMLTAARVLQGFGGGGLMTLSQALIGETVPPRERVRYQGFLASTGVFSTGFGAVAGGLLTQHFGWRSVFFVFVPVGLLAMVLVRRLPVPAQQVQRFRFDFLGLLWFAIFIISTLVMLRQVQDFTLSVIPISVGLTVLAVAAVVLLIRREGKTPHPLFPLPLFRNPVIWRCDGMAFCHGALMVSLATFFPLYLRVGLGADAGLIGLSLLPVTAAVPLGSILVGQLVGLTGGRTAIFPSVGLIFVVATLVTAGIWLEDFDATQLAILLGVGSLFLGTVMNVVQVTVQVAAGPAMLGTAAASVQFSRSTGAAVGTALVGVALFAVLAATDTEAAHMFAAILQQGPDALSALSPERQGVVQAEIGGAFRAAFLSIAGFGLVAMILAWTLPLRRI
jgi:MFS family permease